jgi:hypothetical protein
MNRVSTGGGSAGEGSTHAGSDGGASRLERRARRLLRAYPPGYRAHRGEEILGTLLEATPPGRGWPQPRDAASVLTGGLRARRKANLRLAEAVSLRQAGILAIALYLCGLLNHELGLLRFPGWSPDPVGLGWRALLPCVPLAVTVAAAWSRRPRLVAVSAAAATAALAYVAFAGLSLPGGHGGGAVESALSALTVPLLSLAALTLLTRSVQRPPRSWLWLVGLAVGVTVLGVVAARLQLGPAEHALAWLGRWTATAGSAYSPLSAIIVGVSLGWLVTDSRPLIGVAGSLYLTQLGTLMAGPSVPGVNWTEFIELNVPLAVALVLVRLIQRRARRSPPTTS